MIKPTNPWILTDMVPKDVPFDSKRCIPPKTRPVFTATINDFMCEISRNQQGQVTALLHRNFKTGEAKL